MNYVNNKCIMILGSIFLRRVTPSELVSGGEFGSALNIEFRTTKLQKICEDFELAKREWGDKRARTIIRRINEIQSAECIADLNYAPPTRCHLLKPHNKGVYAVDVVHPFRLLFQAISEDGASLGNVNPSQVTWVRILEVKDYHD